MRVCLITGGNSRHIAAAEILDAAGFRLDVLVDTLSGWAEQERTRPLGTYFDRVRAAERQLYGELRPWPRDVAVHCLSLEEIDQDFAGEHDERVFRDTIENADAIVLYGCNYLFGTCLAPLETHGALSIHLGISPHYRGNGANFWAAYDGHPDLIGATVQRIGRRPDCGPVLFYARPPRPNAAAAYDYFNQAMASVGTVFADLALLLSNANPATVPALESSGPVLRNSTAEDFTDAVATEFLARTEMACRPDHSGIALPSAKDALDRRRR
jgi:hypothetical protein